MPFDLRPLGYSYQEAKSFLDNLSAEGRNIYLGPQHTLDALYPFCLAFTIALAIALLVPLTKVWKFLFSLVAWPGMVFDYFENAYVRDLLLTPPESVTPAMVSLASRMTVLKSVFSTIAFLVLILMLAAWLYRRWAISRNPG